MEGRRRGGHVSVMEGSFLERRRRVVAVPTPSNVSANCRPVKRSPKYRYFPLDSVETAVAVLSWLPLDARCTRSEPWMKRASTRPSFSQARASAHGCRWITAGFALPLLCRQAAVHRSGDGFVVIGTAIDRVMMDNCGFELACFSARGFCT